MGENGGGVRVLPVEAPFAAVTGGSGCNTLIKLACGSCHRICRKTDHISRITCLEALCCPCVAHGKATKWATGTDETYLCLFCPLAACCLAERARANIEAKIHNWHKERGDPRAVGSPEPHSWTCCAFFMCCGFCVLAQNVEAGLVFDEHQEAFLRG